MANVKTMTKHEKTDFRRFGLEVISFRPILRAMVKWQNFQGFRLLLRTIENRPLYSLILKVDFILSFLPIATFWPKT